MKEDLEDDTVDRGTTAKLKFMLDVNKKTHTLCCLNYNVNTIDGESIQMVVKYSISIKPEFDEV